MVFVPTDPIVLDEIAGEHQELRRQLAQFHEALAAREADRIELFAALDSLTSAFTSHFLHEERDGYFADVLAVAPHLQLKIALLSDQHSEFLQMLDHLHGVTAIHFGSPHTWRALELCFNEFVARLLDHEQAEDSLIQEAYACDLGDAD